MSNDRSINIMLTDARQSWPIRILWTLMFWGFLGLCIWVTRDNVGWSFVLGIIFLLTLALVVLGRAAHMQNKFRSLDELQVWLDEQRG